MLRFLELNRRGRRIAVRCISTAFAWWSWRREFIGSPGCFLRWRHSPTAGTPAGSCRPAN